MARDLRLLLFAVGLPALLLAGAGIRLVQIEMRRAERHHAFAARKEFRPPPPGKIDGKPHQPRRHHMACVFSEEDSFAAERVLWIGGCVIGLLFLSLISGGWLLVRSAHEAREEVKRKDQFIANISDEFKTPLTTICLCADLAQEEGLSVEKRQQMLASIQSEAARLKKIVQAEDFPLGWSEAKE